MKLCIVLALATASSAQPFTPAELPKEWAKLSMWELSSRPDFFHLPWNTRYSVLAAKYPAFLQVDSKGQAKILDESNIAFERAAKIGPHRLILWNPGKECCDKFVRDDVTHWSAWASGVLVGVSIGNMGKYWEVKVYVDNDISTRRRLLVDPELVSMSSESPKVYSLKRVRADDIAKAALRGARWRAAFVAFGGAMQTTTTTTVESGSVNGRSNGASYDGVYSGTSRTTRPDYAARRRAARQVSEIRADASARAEGVLTDALKRNTLFPGDSVLGSVYFEDPRGDENAVTVRVIVDELSFEFPLTRQIPNK